MDTLLEKYNLPKLIQENPENLNHPISNKEMEFVAPRKLSQKEIPRPRQFHW